MFYNLFQSHFILHLRKVKINEKKEAWRTFYVWRLKIIIIIINSCNISGKKYKDKIMIVFLVSLIINFIIVTGCHRTSNISWSLDILQLWPKIITVLDSWWRHFSFTNTPTPKRFSWPIVVTTKRLVRVSLITLDHNISFYSRDFTIFLVKKLIKTFWNNIFLSV